MAPRQLAFAAATAPLLTSPASRTGGRQSAAVAWPRGVAVFGAPRRRAAAPAGASAGPGRDAVAAVRRRVLVRAAADGSPPSLQAVPIVDTPAPRGRVAVGLAAWVVLVLWQFVFAPGELGGGDFLAEFLANPTAPDVPTLAWAAFNAVAVMSGCFVALLAAGSGRAQRPLPAAPFVLGGVMLGGASLGPYLALRRARPAVEVVGGGKGGEVAQAAVDETGKAATTGGDAPAAADDDDDDDDTPPFGHSALLSVGESKLFAAGLVAVAAWCYVTAFVPLGAPFEAWDLILYSRGVDWGVAVTSDRTVAATMADLAYLSVAIWGPLTEDMRRRRLYDGGWADVLFAASVMAVPVFGVALYALLRPPLPRRGEDPSAGADA